MDLFAARDYEFTGGVFNFQIPSEVNPRGLRVSFGDISTGAVEAWLHDWHLYMFPPDQGFVRRLAHAVMGVELVHLNNRLESEYFYHALVYPNGTFQPIYDSSNNTTIMIAQFVVAGLDRIDISVEASGVGSGGRARMVELRQSAIGVPRNERRQ